MRREKIAGFGLLALLLISCSAIQTLTGSVVSSPYESYVKSLEKSGLSSTTMAQTWLKAGDPSLHDSIIITLPFRETGFFASAEPQARFYRFDVKDGQVLTLTGMLKAKENIRLFADAFFLKENEWSRVAHNDSTLTVTYEFEKSGSCLVRLQPELLINAYYSITLSVTPVLLNPVVGATNKSIGSFYGDPRDGGKRLHEGIDIFAPKGTLIVAPTEGTITRIGNSILGGKTIWMNDSKRGHSYYFAHLDSQIARSGMKVKQGDILGTVGNTGNAINTPSHLHFGVYQTASKDPIAYIRTMEKLVNEMIPDTLFQSIVFRTNQKNVSLYSGPSSKLKNRQEVTKDTYLKIIAQSNDWYRVITADEREGFVEKKKVTPAERGNRFLVKNSMLILSEAKRDAIPIAEIGAQQVEGLATYKHFRFIKTQQGVLGWIDLSTL